MTFFFLFFSISGKSIREKLVEKYNVRKIGTGVGLGYFEEA